jgi:hypothetical protein
MIYCAFKLCESLCFYFVNLCATAFNHTEIHGETLSYTKKYSELCIKLCG